MPITSFRAIIEIAVSHKEEPQGKQLHATGAQYKRPSPCQDAVTSSVRISYKIAQFFKCSCHCTAILKILQSHDNSEGTHPGMAGS